MTQGLNHLRERDATGYAAAMRRGLVGALAALVIASTALAATRPPAPAISGRTVQGGTASLAALRGKPVFVNVWSSW
jgi:hypothetical protein